MLIEHELYSFLKIWLQQFFYLSMVFGHRKNLHGYKACSKGIPIFPQPHHLVDLQRMLTFYGSRNFDGGASKNDFDTSDLHNDPLLHFFITWNSQQLAPHPVSHINVIAGTG